MKKAVEYFEKYFAGQGKSLSELNALEMFARDGSWATIELARRVKHIEAWEIDERFIDDLKSNLPSSATVRCMDSIDYINKIKSEVSVPLFDIISIDNSNGLYGDGECEHFGFLHNIPALLRPSLSAVVFYVNLKPYDPRECKSKALKSYDDFGMRGAGIDEWFARRDAFYGCSARALNKDFVVQFYISFLEKAGMRHPEFLGFSQATDFDGRFCFGSN